MEGLGGEAVGVFDEFAHDGGEGDFLGFAAGHESLVEWREDGIVFAGRKRGHVEGFARGGADRPESGVGRAACLNPG